MLAPTKNRLIETFLMQHYLANLGSSPTHTISSLFLFAMHTSKTKFYIVTLQSTKEAHDIAKETNFRAFCL